MGQQHTALLPGRLLVQSESQPILVASQVLGQWADGYTPQLAIRNAARLHAPQPSQESEEYK
jgi:hypothetical protein